MRQSITATALLVLLAVGIPVALLTPGTASADPINSNTTTFTATCTNLGDITAVAVFFPSPLARGATSAFQVVGTNTVLIWFTPGTDRLANEAETTCTITSINGEPAGGEVASFIAGQLTVEEFFGTGFRESAPDGIEVLDLSDCGDTEDATNMFVQTITGPVVWTGFIEGTGRRLQKTLVNRCLLVGEIVQTNATARWLDTFESLTVAGRTGGAVLEHVLRAHLVPQGGFLIEGRSRILCGTGELRGVHGEGTITTSTGDPTPYQYWVHFGHNHDVGFDFLCQDLPVSQSEGQ